MVAVDEIWDIHLHTAMTGEHFQTLRLRQSQTLADLHRAVVEIRPYFSCHVSVVWDSRELAHDSTTSLEDAGLCHGSIVHVIWRKWRMLLSASEDCTARLWNIETGKCELQLGGHRGDVNSVAVSPCRLFAVTSCDDCTARVWDLRSASTVLILTGHKNEVWYSTFSPDGAFILTASRDGTAKLWSSATGDHIQTYAGHRSSVRLAEFSPDGTHIVTASSDASAKIWDVDAGSEMLTIPTHDSVISAAFLSGGRCVALALQRCVVQLYDIESGICQLEVEGWSVAVSPDGHSMLTTTARVARLWDLGSGKCLQTFAGHKDEVHCAAFSDDGSCIATSSDDATVRVWSCESGECLWELSGHQGKVLWTCF